MTRLHHILLSGLAIAILLQGCEAIIIGGAATGATTAHDRRTTGTFVEDQNIELKAGGALSKDKEISDTSHINVTSYNQVVLITGETPNDSLRTRAGNIVRNIEKVRRVQNELTIASPSSLSSRASDTWLTSKVKTSLLKVKGHEGFDPTRVKVVTENGSVFLMGLLRRSEADSVIEVVRKVGGVQRVVKIFEYID